ncbi:MAG TPA: ABC transporter ATP-binding protein [Gemmatimonadales bacterium]|nr:ABC transporter ATP-binding protein [Gemmatimonadales bacterium]
MTPALRIEGLRKTFPGPPPIEAVAGIDLEVAPGEIFALLGPNGAGKTTTVGICTTRVRPGAGRVLVGGREVTAHGAAIKRSIGVVPQYNTLDRACTVHENLYYHCRYFGFSGAEARQRTAELLEQFRLADRGASMALSLSGGLAQRVQIARAVAHRPAMLFLDEPTAGLDPQSRLALWELVRGLKAAGITVLLTTHYMEEADRLSDRLAIMDHGRILVTGTPAKLKQRVSAATVVELEVERPGEALRAALAALPTVREVHPTAAGYRVLAASREGLLPRLVELAVPAGLRDVAIHDPTLETVFIQLTGRELRD